MNTTVSAFTLRTLRHTGSGVSTRFTATLALNKITVAKITGESGPTSYVEVEPINQFYWDQFQTLSAAAAPEVEEGDDAALMRILQMADEAYHARRLQVVSLRFTTFRLRGDPPGVFRYLRGRPYSLKVEGELRLTFGRRIEQIFRRGAGADVAFDAAHA